MQVGLIDPFKGGEVTVNTFLKAAREACEYPNVEQPFMCLDLTFIYVLLREGFGLEGNTKMFVSKLPRLVYSSSFSLAFVNFAYIYISFH